MAWARLQASFAVPEATQIDVKQPTGIALGSLSIAADTEYANTDALLGDLQAQLVALAGPGTWVLSASSAGVVQIATSAGNFDWTWTTGTFVRNWLGYAGNVVNQASPWIAGTTHTGGLYLGEMPLSGFEAAGFESVRSVAVSVQARGGGHDAVHVAGALLRTRLLTLPLTRSGGNWTEYNAWRTWLELIADGRTYTLWPDGDLLAVSEVQRFRGPEETELRPRFDRLFDRFAVTIEVEA